MEQNYRSRKQSFIECNIETLEREFYPSKKWLSKNSNSEEPLDLSVVDNVLNDLKNVNRTQNKRIFNRQTIRQVLEQLCIIRDQKFKDAVEGRIRVDKKPNHDDIKWIESLPEEWPQLENNQFNKEKLEEYTRLRSNVYQVQKDYIAIKEKLECYKVLHKLMEPLNTSTIQQSLITRDSPVVKEIAKMRILIPKLLSTLERKHEFLKRSREERKDESRTRTNTMDAIR
ncbi:11508_t:CDS:2, partial [Acaulospora morrowiae]